MMRCLLKFITGLSLVLLLPMHVLAADSGQAIMARVDARDDGDNRTENITMTLIDKNGHERQRKLQSFRKDEGSNVRQLLFFQEPANVRNTGFLTYDYQDPNRDNDQWIYLPELYKTKRIASSDKSQPFMGSDFSYADMTRRILDEWDFKVLGEKEVRGTMTWLIEALPISNEVAKRYGYAKSVLFVHPEINMVIRAVHWRTDGKLKYLDIASLEEIDGVWTATELDMRTVEGKETIHRTIMSFSNVRYNQGLDESIFTQRRLEKGL